MSFCPWITHKGPIWVAHLEPKQLFLLYSHIKPTWAPPWVAHLEPQPTLAHLSHVKPTWAPEGHVTWDLTRSIYHVLPFHLFQEELTSLAEAWNCHRMQRHRNMVEPCGKPIIMHTAPELYNSENKLVGVDALEVELCMEQSVFKDGQPCRDPVVFELCCDLMVENDLDVPQSPQEAVTLYNTLRDIIYRDL